MPFPKGNTYGRKNVGKGRKSAYKEKANAEWLKDMFFKPHTKEEMRELAKGDSHSIADAWIIAAWQGDLEAIRMMVGKLFPNLSAVDLKAKVNQVVSFTDWTREALQEIAKQNKNATKRKS